MAQDVEIVKAGQGHATGHIPAAALAFQGRAHRQDVPGEEDGIDLRHGFHQMHDGFRAGAEAGGALQDQRIIRLSPELLQRA